MYFFLHSRVLLINGALNGALYDLERGGIFSVSATLKKILALTEKGVSIKNLPNKEVIIQALKNLEQLGLGYFSDDNNQPEKVEIKKRKPKLNMMWLALNSNCNLVCEHCYATSKPGPLDGTLKIEFLFAAMAEAKEIFDLECIQLIGGEPLLLGKEKVTTIINEAYRLGIPTIEVFTNGYLIDDYYIQLFKEKKVNVAISIYSDTPEEHDAVTNRKGSWDKTVKAIKKVNSANIPLRFGVVAMAQNKNTVANTIPWLSKEIGIPAQEKLYDVIRSCGRGNNKATIPWELFLQQHVRVEPDFPPVTIETLETTMYGNVCWSDEICIMPNGDVTPCEMEFEHVQGNIMEQTLSEIILGESGDMAQRLTKDKIEICKDCEYRYACWECRAMAHQLDTNRFSKPLTCMHNPYTGAWESPPENLGQLLGQDI